MSNYSQKFNKFDLAREVLANRYMLTTLLVNINNLVYFLEGKEKALRELLPEDKRKGLHKVIKFFLCSGVGRLLCLYLFAVAE